MDHARKMRRKKDACSEYMESTQPSFWSFRLISHAIEKLWSIATAEAHVYRSWAAGQAGVWISRHLIRTKKMPSGQYEWRTFVLSEADFHADSDDSFGGDELLLQTDMYCIVSEPSWTQDSWLRESCSSFQTWLLLNNWVTSVLFW